MLHSSRPTPEQRVELANGSLRLDFDPRTSDTMYNYLHVRRPDTGAWERVHNFGVDVRAPRADKPEQILNTIGMNVELRRDGNAMRVVYPNPLIQYRQFDEKIGSADLVRRYPDIGRDEMKDLVHSDASAEFVYRIDPEQCAFEITGRVLGGKVSDITYIIDALWTDNTGLPTHQYVEGLPEFDIRTAEGQLCKEIWVQNVGYIIFYRQDGNGVPVALLPMEPIKTGVCNYFDNWKCLQDFGLSAVNQQYVPQRPAVTAANDFGYLAEPKADGTFAGVRVALFPELGWAKGGCGHVLRDRIEEAVTQRHYQYVRAWKRRENNLMPLMTLRGQPNHRGTESPAARQGPTDWGSGGASPFTRPPTPPAA